MVRGDEKDAIIEQNLQIIEKQRQTLALFHMKLTASYYTQEALNSVLAELVELAGNLDDGPIAYTTALQAAQTHSKELTAYVHHRTFCEGVLAQDGSLYYKDCTCGLQKLLPPVPGA